MLRPTDGVLILRLGAVGDVVRTLPSLAALRRALPLSRIAWVVEPGSLTLLPGMPWLNEVFVFPRTAMGSRALRRDPVRLLRELKSFLTQVRRFEPAVSLDFQGSVKSSLLAKLSAAPWRVGYVRDASREGSFLLNNCLVEPSSKRLNRIWKHLELLGPLGIKHSPMEFPFPERKPTIKVTEFLRTLGQGIPVAVHPGTSLRQSHKRWPEERFVTLVRSLRRAALLPVLTWGPGEEEMVQRILAQSGGDGFAAPALSLLEMRELLASCRCFVGGDTGPMHLAWTQGIPVVALFGSTDPVINGPLGAGHRILAPAWQPGNPFPRRGDAAAMREISVEDVLQSTLEIVGRNATQEPQAFPC